MKFGIQTYTWQMSYEKYREYLPEILGIISKGGLHGVESEVCMLGPYRKNSQKLVEDLERSGIKLAALCLACDWKFQEETLEEREEAVFALEFLQKFPGAVLNLCQIPGNDREDVRERQKHALSCINAVAERAAELGISAAFHPNSPPGSIFRIQNDYEVLMEGLNPQFVGFCPDAGHIAKGGMEVLSIFEQYMPLIRHVHYKDMGNSGDWRGMGQGDISFREITALLRDKNYQGWIMVEEESEAARLQPDEMTLQNCVYVREQLGG